MEAFRHDRPTGTGGQRPGRRGMIIQAAAVLALLGLAALLGFHLMTSKPRAGRHEPPQRQPRLVEVTPVQLANVPVTVAAWGAVRPSRQTTVTPEVAGRVRTVADGLDPGTLLDEGAPVVTLDDRDYQLRVRQAQADLTRAQADLSLEQGQQAIARREYQLLKQPASDGEQALMLRKPQLASAHASVDSAKASLDQARLDLQRTKVTAPYRGLVLERDVAPGAQVTTSTALAKLAGVGTWWVELSVPVADLRWVQTPGESDDGDGSRVTLDYDSVWRQGEHRTGQVLRILGDLDENARMAKVLVAVDDPLALTPANAGQPRLIIGAFLRGRIRGRVLQHAVSIDPAWLRDGNTVWVMNDQDRLERRPVEVAYRDDERVLIAGGLEAGERIVTSTITAVDEGMPLRVRQVAVPDTSESGR